MTRQLLEKYGCKPIGKSNIDGENVLCDKGFAIKYDISRIRKDERISISRSFSDSDIVIQFTGANARPRMDPALMIIAPRDNDGKIIDPLITWLSSEYKRNQYYWGAAKDNYSSHYSKTNFNNHIYRAGGAADIIIYLDKTYTLNDKPDNAWFANRVQYYKNNVMEFIHIMGCLNYDAFAKEICGMSTRRFRKYGLGGFMPEQDILDTTIENMERILGIGERELMTPGDTIYVPVFTMNYMKSFIESIPGGGYVDLSEKIDIIPTGGNIPIADSFALCIGETNIKGLEGLENIHMVFIERAKAAPEDDIWYIALLYNKKKRDLEIDWVFKDSRKKNIYVAINKGKYADGRNSYDYKKFADKYVELAIAAEIHIKDYNFYTMYR